MLADRVIAFYATFRYAIRYHSVLLMENMTIPNAFSMKNDDRVLNDIKELFIIYC